MKTGHIYFAVLLLIFLLETSVQGAVSRQGNKVSIIDRTGTSWDVTQARTLGFHPEKFQYGIGKYAFTPLNNDNVKSVPKKIRGNQRIIGVRDKDQVHAYSVDKLRFHEIANTLLGDRPIAAGY
jgi:hypothetical protein